MHWAAPSRLRSPNSSFWTAGSREEEGDEAEEEESDEAEEEESDEAEEEESEEEESDEEEEESGETEEEWSDETEEDESDETEEEEEDYSQRGGMYEEEAGETARFARRCFSQLEEKEEALARAEAALMQAEVVIHKQKAELEELQAGKLEEMEEWKTANILLQMRGNLIKSQKAEIEGLRELEQQRVQELERAADVIQRQKEEIELLNSQAVLPIEHESIQHAIKQMKGEYKAVMAKKDEEIKALQMALYSARANEEAKKLEQASSAAQAKKEQRRKKQKNFTDSHFPPSNKSIGTTTIVSRWARAAEINIKQLFPKDHLQPNIHQRAPGSCWLLHSIACLLEFPGEIAKLFKDKQIQPSSEYTLQLYCTGTRKWTDVTLDDHVPVHADGRPCFFSSEDNELWPILLEKAFAKAFGSYSALSGGLPFFALQMLTGCDTSLFAWDGATWEELFDRRDEQKQHSIKAQNVQKPDWSSSTSDEAGDEYRRLMTDKRMLERLVQAVHKHAWLVAACTIGSEQGVVDGHAYAVIQIKEVEGFQLLQIRNPWGGGDKFERLQEASGRGKWDAYPAVKSLVASSIWVSVK